ncbi:MAG: carbohydrate ABC transporter permease [Caldilineaceae bacterium SB0661_bin_32]|uniref:Carbohydrate ABC transporter permease n=1 Tax=Caldilineaceae bacterium SB0661_bin_32 TaxID=2605255 RepID=A0A6B1D2Q8_9CHLR|nr:carbohydrate ABC transporter permease [Caldilineaceae bacterium SB0661_bin_32]
MRQKNAGATALPEEKKMTLRQRLFVLFTHFYLFPLAVVAVFPLYWLMSTSVKFRGNILRFPPQWFPDPITIENYQRLFITNPFEIWYFNSLVITISATLGATLSASLVAYGFARLNFLGRNIWFAVVLATLMVPESVLIIPRFALMRFFGWIDTWIPLILPFFLGGGAFNIFLLRQFFRTIPLEFDEAAKIDGASNLRIFWQILLPNLKPVLAVVVVFTAIFNWNSFMSPLVFINTTEKLPVAVGIQMVLAGSQAGPGNTGAMMAASTLITIPVIMLFAFSQKYFMQGIVLTGLSGR